MYGEIGRSGENINPDLYCQQMMRFKREVEKKLPELINRKGVEHAILGKKHASNAGYSYSPVVLWTRIGLNLKGLGDCEFKGSEALDKGRKFEGKCGRGPCRPGPGGQMPP
ncbi:hypothetical protein EVAR_10029_1 [Eumeta japonica]|uniref:Uncharacterized protein n=1 Tax=Eumeta variegata TaxID=151549 RepID=A0A4C1TR38_EUMVA|nr:hypothetical protein EVAR_10029_1 [Eumeta japonica]